jgi:DNA invertase Pin-like site-specific DNA recombinase
VNAVIYARYSSDGQREESIEGQLRECKDFADKNGMTVIGDFIDRAYSAKTDARPQFQKMIKDSAKGLFDVVIVWKLDRFARNRYDSAHYKTMLKKNGVRVISATEAIATDSTGILLESLLEGYAEFFSVELSEKVVRGMTENAMKSKYNGGVIPMGYAINKEQHFEIDPLTAPIVLEVFNSYSDGSTVTEIVNTLNARGIRSVRGGSITHNIVTTILKNRRYIGEFRYRDVVNPDGIPAIVPKDLFNRVQELLAKNKKAPARHKAEDDYLLTTKLFCGLCNAFMVGESGTSKTGKVHRYYKCVSVKKRRGCKKKPVKKAWIEDLVVAEAVQMIGSDAILSKIADMVLELQKQENVTLPLLKKQLTETERSIENMLNAIQQGILTSSTKQRLEELEAAKSDIKVKILQEQIHKPLLTKEQILFWLHKFRGIDISKKDQRQRLIDTFVNAIYLYDDKIVLTFNYKEGSKTLSLKDLESSDLFRDGLGMRRFAYLGTHHLILQVLKTKNCFFRLSLYENMI